MASLTGGWGIDQVNPHSFDQDFGSYSIMKHHLVATNHAKHWRPSYIFLLWLWLGWLKGISIGKHRFASKISGYEFWWFMQLSDVSSIKHDKPDNSSPCLDGRPFVKMMFPLRNMTHMCNAFHSQNQKWIEMVVPYRWKTYGLVRSANE